jgi:hypothetical protein
MPSMQPQASTPVRPSRFSHTALASAAALAGFSPLSFADFIEDSSATFENPQHVFQPRLSRWHQCPAIQA